MLRYVVLTKKRGETPLQALTAWKQMHPAYAAVPAAYAGRLDPLATGALLVLLGDECKNQCRYTTLDKEYEIEVVLDLTTDTGDALGMPRYEGLITHPDSVTHALTKVLGTHRVPYPAFSSKPVRGKPLFLHTLEGTLDPKDIPTHLETVHRISLLEKAELQGTELQARIFDALAYVPRSDEPSKILGADFRQNAIRVAWHELFAKLPERTFTVLTLRVSCGSGTYMRTLASRIARELGTTGFALSIHRTKIGRFNRMLGWWRTFR